MKILLFLAPPLSLHNLSGFRQGKPITASGSSVSGTACADTTSRHPILPGRYWSHPGTHGLPLRHAPAWMPEGNLLVSAALPAQLRTGPASHSSLFKMAKSIQVLQQQRGHKMRNDVIVVKEVYKLLNTTCWSGRAFLFPLLGKRLVCEHLLSAKKGEGRLWLSLASQINGCFFWCCLGLSSRYFSPRLLFGVYRIKLGCSSWIASFSDRSSGAYASIRFLRLP